MSPTLLRKVNNDMRRFDYTEKSLISIIDKRSPQAEESIMDKHYVGVNDSGERLWRF